jgi:hypothetical protein
MVLKKLAEIGLGDSSGFGYARNLKISAGRRDVRVEP